MSTLLTQDQGGDGNGTRLVNWGTLSQKSRRFTPLKHSHNQLINTVHMVSLQVLCRLTHTTFALGRPYKNVEKTVFDNL